jgi:cytoskeletal protein CcmA (bactofilin family)
MKQLCTNSGGFVLAASLFLLLTLTLVVVTIAHRNTFDEAMAGNQRDFVNAMGVTESGVEAGFALVKENYVNGGNFDVDQLTGYSSNPLLTGSLSGGSYAVTVPVVNANLLVLNSVGSVAGAEREIEVVLEVDSSGTWDYAILTSDSINVMSGDPIIYGPYADVHTNMHFYISGNPEIDGSISATGVLDISGNPTVGGEQTSGADNVDIPHVYPPEHRGNANIVLTPDCRVTAADGSEIADLSDGGKWHGWDCSVGDKWTMADSSPDGGLYDAFYYVEGNVVISGGPEALWYASFVAEGYIEVSGNPYFHPWGYGAGNDTGSEVGDKILFLAGNDLKINGNPDQEFIGIMAAHMEVGVSGNPYLEGSILAENGLHGEGQEVASGMEIKNIIDNNEFNGNMVLNASGDGLGGAGQPLIVSAWRELVH